MQVILLKDFENLGYKHDVVEVKPGYGRNFLIPQGMAIIANKANMGDLDEIKSKEAAVEAAKQAEYQEMATKMEGVVLKIGAKAGQSGKIFGSVTNVQISAALKEQLDLDIERRKIEISEEVKELGTYHAKLNLHPEVQPNVAFEVVAE
ncbi:MAG: 50S ribosomal protein L9 [Saprospiraceae bacterium]